jgi:two-component system chemotaxis sensor kinase CheA
MELPEEIVAKFRVIAQERLTRIETEWAQILSSVGDDTTLHREVHTLKGESRVLGFTDVNLVAHKLEDLLVLARSSGYAVDEDFDLTVNMALRFMSMLVRKRVGSQLSGIDLPGFVRQIDQLLVEAKPKMASRTRTGNLIPLKQPTRPRVSPGLRDRLGPVAVDAYIEYALASGGRRDRLRASWHSMRELLGLQRAHIGANQLIHHEGGAKSLAKDLAKEVFVAFTGETVEVTSEVLALADVAVLHLVRNAIDHGLETPEARVQVNKPRVGRITIRTGMAADRFVLTVEDDGQGINAERIRDRAVELGLLPRGVELDDNEKLLEVMCMPGFSTRSVATDISGRGVGLDAVRGGIADLGGVLTLANQPGRGASWTMTMPVPQLAIQAIVLRVPSVPFPIALDHRWQLIEGSSALRKLVVSSALGLGPGEPGTSYVFESDAGAVEIPCERKPVTAQVRRLVPAPSNQVGEVVVVDSIEALLIRPDMLWT